MPHSVTSFRYSRITTGTEDGGRYLQTETERRESDARERRGEERGDAEGSVKEKITSGRERSSLVCGGVGDGWWELEELEVGHVPELGDDKHNEIGGREVVDQVQQLHVLDVAPVCIRMYVCIHVCMYVCRLMRLRWLTCGLL